MPAVPELIEVELYRRLAEQAHRARRSRRSTRPDAWYLKRGTTAAMLQAALVGRTIRGVRRHGKLLLLDIEGGRRTACADDRSPAQGPTLGLRFGMTGRLIVDDVGRHRAAGVRERS